MTAHHDTFELSLEKSQAWLGEIQSLARWPDRHRAVAALRATLHALRDRLDVEHVAQLGSQLPLIVRGLYYEGWRPGGKPLRVRSLDAFLALVSRDYPEDDVERAVRAVLVVLCRHTTLGLTDKIRQALPGPLRDLWPVSPDREMSIG